MRPGLTAGLAVLALGAAATSGAAAADAAAGDAAAERLVSNRFAPLARPLLSGGDAAPLLTKPPIIAPTAPTPSDAGPRFRLKGVDFVIEGSSPFGEDYLRAAAEPLIGADVAFKDLEAFRRLLAAELVAAGYVAAGVSIPEQRVRDGVVLFRVVVGRLASVAISGARIGDGVGELKADYVGRRVSGDGDEPLNLNVMQERLRALIADRNIDRVNAAVRPTGAPGEAELTVDVAVRRPWDLSFAVSNDGASSSGELKASFSGALRNVTGYGDQIALDLFRTEGAGGAAITLDGPLPDGSATPYLRLEGRRARVIEAPLDDLDIESEILAVTAGLSAPLFADSADYLGLAAELTLKRTETTLGDEPFSFSPGVPANGVTQLTVLSLIQEYRRRDVDWALAARSSLNFGLDAFGATSNPGGEPDGRFVSWIGQAQGVLAVSDDVSLIARTQVQLADRPLLPAAEVVIGGRATVRGFREGAVVSDQAVAATLEADVTLGRLRLPDTNAAIETPVILTPFIDFGRAWNVGEGGGGALIGAGAGVRWSPSPHVSLALEGAYGLLNDTDRRKIRNGAVFFLVSLSF